MKNTSFALLSLLVLTSCSTIDGWFKSEEQQVATESRRTPIHNRTMLNPPKPAGFNLPGAQFQAQVPPAPNPFSAGSVGFSNPNQPPLVITQAQAPQYSAPVQLPNSPVISNPYGAGILGAPDRRTPSFNSQAQGFAVSEIPPAPSPVPQISQTELPQEFLTPSTSRGIVIESPNINEYPKLAQIPPAPMIQTKPVQLDERVQELKRELAASNEARRNIQVTPPPAPMIQVAAPTPPPAPMIKVTAPTPPPAPMVKVTAKNPNIEPPMIKPIAVEPMIKRSVVADSYTPPVARPSYSGQRQAMTTLSDLRAPNSFSRRRGEVKSVRLPARYSSNSRDGLSRHSNSRRSF